MVRRPEQPPEWRATVDGLRSPPPPVFGLRGSRWTLGSVVLATWWARAESPAEDVPQIEERQEVGLVVGLRLDGSGWLVSVDFGEPTDAPAVFPVSQIQAWPTET